jgi:hypothetical protein
MRDVEPSELTVADQVIGFYTLAGMGAPPGTDVVTVNTLANGPRLVVPSPEGAELDDADLAARLSRDLTALLGGPWTIEGDRLRLVDGMLTPDRRRADGVRSDTGPLGWVAAEHDGWICQAVVTTTAQAVALVRLLREDEALAAPGQPASRPLGEVPELLSTLAPRVEIGRDRSSEAQPNVFDTVLVGDATRVRAGVRERQGADWMPVGGEFGYCYVVRVDAPNPDSRARG